MIATPTSFADAPDSGRRSRDLLGNMLRTVRLTGSAFMNARLTAPFGVMTARHFDAGKPLARLRHVSIFHLIASGACTIELPGEQPRDVCEGDVLLVPFAQEHLLWHGDYREVVNGETLVRPAPISGMWKIDYGGGGNTTRVVCGFIESSEFLFSPMFRTLPPLLVYRAGADRVGAVITSTVRQILELVDTSTPGAELILGQLMEMLFVEVLRRYAADLPPDSKGLLAALNDPLVCRALQMVHAEPARRWTVEHIARAAGTSRTVLAERFNTLLGQAPIEYVTAWRMQVAAARLRGSDDSLAAIAANVGYESEAAFNRAFKRVTGVTPGRWRDGVPQSGPALPRD